MRARNGGLATHGHHTMLGLTAQPIARADAVLHPGQNGFVLKSPSLQKAGNLEDMRVRRPQPEDAIVRRKVANGQRFDFLDGQAGIRNGAAVGGVRLPRRVLTICYGTVSLPSSGKRPLGWTA